MLLAGLGGIGGAVLGGVVTAGFAATRDWPFPLPLWVLGGAGAATILVGAIAGAYPAARGALGWLLGGRDGRLLLITIGALFGRPMLTLGVVAATSMLSLLLRVYLVRRLVRTPASRGRPV